MHAGALALAEGIRANNALHQLELSHNPLCRVVDGVAKKEGLKALVDAMRLNQNLETVGMTSVQSGGSYHRGRASRYDPKSPDGHYALDLGQPWDWFLAETLYERMATEPGESWNYAKLDGKPVQWPADGSAWKIPQPAEGKSIVLEFDYVTSKRGLEASFKLDLSNPCDLFLAEQLLLRTSAADDESCRECKLNDAPFPTSSELPDKGMLHFVYFSTKPQDELVFDLKLDLSAPNDKAPLDPSSPARRRARICPSARVLRGRARARSFSRRTPAPHR